MQVELIWKYFLHNRIYWEMTVTGRSWVSWCDGNAGVLASNSSHQRNPRSPSCSACIPQTPVNLLSSKSPLRDSELEQMQASYPVGN